MLSHTSGALRYTTLSHFHYAQILPKDGVAGRRTRGSGRAGREIVLGKLKKELDVLQRCALRCSRNTCTCNGVTVAAAAVESAMHKCFQNHLVFLGMHGPT